MEKSLTKELKKTTTLLLIITVMLAISSCGGQQKPGVQMQTPFIGGNVALDFALQQGSPPAVVLDDSRQEFAFGLIVTNMGEADVGYDTENPYVVFRLTGFKPSDFGVDNADDLIYDFESNHIQLLGSKKNFDGTILPGGITSVMFEGLTYTQKLAGGSRTQDLRVEACYDYSNYATVNLCFKDSMIENAADSSICTLTGEKGPANSGGPIQVTSVTESPLGPYKAHITVNIEHVGTGEFYGRQRGSEADEGEEETCDPNVLNQNRHRVYVKLWSSNPNGGVDDDMEISCPLLGGDNEGTLQMGIAGAQNGLATNTVLTCTVTSKNPEGARVYEDTLNFEIDYRYSQYIDQPIVIQSMGR